MISSSKRGRDVKQMGIWWAFWSTLVIVGLGLGIWQWERAAEKRAYLARLEQAPDLHAPQAQPPEGARLVINGEYLPGETLYLDNRIVDGRVGVAALTPFRDDMGQLWLIQRGFLPTEGARETPQVETPSSVVRLAGQWQPANDDALVFGDNREGQRLQRIDLGAWPALPDFAYEGWIHLEEGPGRLSPWWEPSVMPPSRHRGYAIQWWGLSLAALSAMLIGARFMRRDDESRKKEERYP